MNFKRILLTFLALAMVLAGAAAFTAVLHHDPQARTYTNSDTNKSMFIDRALVDLRVAEDGSLKVREQLTYDLGSIAWRGLYQDVILANNERVEDVSVARLIDDVRMPFKPGSGIELGVGGAYGSYGYGVIKDPDRRLRIVWNVSDSGEHSFELRYRLSGAVKNHSDASSLLWDVWGVGWETGVGELTGQVRFPGELKFFAPRAGDLQRRIVKAKQGQRGGSFVIRNLPAKRQVQLQAAGAPLTGMPERASEVLPKLSAAQATIDARNEKLAERSKNLLALSPVWFLLIALAGSLVAALLVFACWNTFGRDTTKMVPAGGSYQYPPEAIPPAVIAKALGGADTDKLVSATLLGFMQRDVFRVLPSVEKKEDVSIRNLVGTTSFDAGKVAEYELPIARLLQAAIDKHPEHSPDFTKLKKYLDAKTAETEIASFDRQVTAQFPAYNLKSTFRGRLRRWLIGLFALILYAIGIFAMIGASDGGIAAVRYDSMKLALIIVGFAPVLVMAAIEGNAFYVLKADQADRVRKWETYKDFFEQMDMSREYPLTVEIWDQALLYAAAFGYAEKVITNMPRTDASGTRLTTADTVGTGWMAGNAAALGSFSSISSGISGVTGMSSSSSSGGGGFSGGGSGGGGGGGW
jgi:uncharacterized membrane protein YgcG